MKTFLTFLILGTTSSLFAQSLSSAINAKSHAFENSIDYFAAQDFANGETSLEEANIQQIGTSHWNLESGFELIEMTHYFSNKGQRALAYLIAELALDHLRKADQAYTTASEPAEVANERELQGDLYLEFLGDRASAENFYAAAIKLSPNTGFAAASLARMQLEDAEVARKVAANSGS